MKIGYSRVSTADQKLDAQLDALKNEGCEKIFSDIASGAKTARPELQEALEFARRDDTLVVYKLDRLGRSLAHLIETVTWLEQFGIGFKSLTEGIDTTTSGGRLVFHIFGAIAEFERNLIKERTQAGLKAARARGRFGGRPPKMTPAKIQQLNALASNHQISVTEICQTLDISKGTYYQYLKKEPQTPKNPTER